jgi:hypothetical protein
VISNYGLGYSAQYFFSPLKVDTWNAYGGWGTVFLLVPAYLEIGTEYVTSNNFYFGVSLTDFVPGISLGIMF